MNLVTLPRHDSESTDCATSICTAPVASLVGQLGWIAMADILDLRCRHLIHIELIFLKTFPSPIMQFFSSMFLTYSLTLYECLWCALSKLYDLFVLTRTSCNRQFLSRWSCGSTPSRMVDKISFCCLKLPWLRHPSLGTDASCCFWYSTDSFY